MIEVGKLYKSFNNGLVECVGIGEEEMHFRRVTIDYTYPRGGWSFPKNEVNYRIERGITPTDIENAMEDSLDSIDNLRSIIEEEQGVIRELEEWWNSLGS